MHELNVNGDEKKACVVAAVEQVGFDHQQEEYSALAKATVPAQRQALFRRDRSPPPWHLTLPLEQTKGRSALQNLDYLFATVVTISGHVVTTMSFTAG